MGIEKCHDCGVEKYIKLDATEESQRIPFGSKRNCRTYSVSFF